MNNKFDIKTLKRLLSYMSEYKPILFVVAICIIISAVSSASASMFIQILVDDYITPMIGQENPVFIKLIQALMTMVAIYVVGVVATWIYNILMVTIAQGVLKRIRDEMFSKMQDFPIRYFDTHTHGDIMSHYTNDTDTLRQMIAQSMPQFLSSVCIIVAVFCAMVYQSLYLTVLVVVMLFIILKTIGFIAGKSTRFFVRQQSSLGDLDGYVEEMINGQKVIKVFNHEDATIEGFREKNDIWKESSTKANSYINSIMPIMNAFGYYLYVILALVGAWMTIEGLENLTIFGKEEMTIGTIAAFLTLSRNFTNPIGQISNQLNSIITAIAGASRIFELMDEKAEDDDGYVTLVNAREENGKIVEVSERTGVWAWKHLHGDGSLTYTKLQGNVVFENVDFSYNPDKKVLKNINIYAEPGQKVAFVGATGAGKTTIANLINRFYDIDKGKIRYDGININKIKKEDLRKSLGVVLQDVNLFTGTVIDNIRYGNPQATDEECIEAAKLANAHNFIMMLPKGYDTLIKGNNSALSQGQKQLLSIARAAVSDPPVMILDEATSSIDNRTEALVQKGMDGLMEGKTAFVIAHRLSTIMNSDVIMVMDHGEIIERGGHNSLIEKKGIYYQLYTGAFELE